MRKVFLFTLLVTALFLIVVSCNQNKSREQMVEEFRSGLTKEDTTEMLQLCKDAMEQLKAKDYKRVLASLYEYDDSTQEVKILSSETREKYLNIFKCFPVLDYECVGYSFQLEGCNDVKYKVTFATAEQAGTPEAPTTSFMFNPVKIDGGWKLCVKTPKDQVDINLR